MPVSVTLPALGESVTEGTVTRWLKKEGDTVAADEPLLEISTDKVDTEIPAPSAGVLVKITVQEDETVAVGAELGVIGDPGEAAPAAAAPAAQPAPEQQAQSDGAGAEAPAAPAVPQQAQPQQEQAPQQAEATTDNAAPPAQESAPAPAQDAAPASVPAQGGAPASSGGVSVTLPALGESVTEGTVTRWLKQEGDNVAADEPLLEISTDKVDTEIPAPSAGVLVKITVREDETVAVGAELGVIGPAGAAAPAAEPPAQAAPPAAPPAPAPEPAAPPAPPAPAPAAEAPAAPAPPAPAPAAPAQSAPAPTAPSGNGQAEDVGNYVTPLVRRLAADNNVDLSKVVGTGVGGRIRKQDVLDAAKSAAPAAAPAAQAPAAQAPAAPVVTPSGAAAPQLGTVEPMSRLRKVIAARMVESLQVSAQLSCWVEADVTRIAKLRQQAKAGFEQREGLKLNFLPFFAKATIEALKQHPKLNASIDVEKGEITYHPHVHLGMAVDTDRGLLVPVVHQADELNLAGLTRSINELAARTRDNKIMPDDLSGGTFTLTNTGSRGALTDTPIINQPQVGILGTGSVVKRPVVLTDAEGNETIAIRSIVMLALTYDHRLVDGADAARFLVTVKERLEEGAFESELGL